MLGDNPIRAPRTGDGKKLIVKKIFKTIQGEGPNVGMPAIFIRLGGCNLACNFCDTEFEGFEELGIDFIINQVSLLSLNDNNIRSVNLVVITGGEPFLQPINNLCIRLLDKKFSIQIETNGTIYREIPKEVEVVCSPKIVGSKYTKIRLDLLDRINALKFLISANKSSYSFVPELRRANDNIPIYVQAMDELNEDLNKKNRDLAIKIAINNNYRLSYQIHKDLGVE